VLFSDKIYLFQWRENPEL